MGFFFPRSDLVTKPAARTGVMAYGPQQGAFVLFGGQGATDQLSDTWEFNGALWVQKSPGASPNKRRGHAMSTGLAVQGISSPAVTVVGGYYNDGSDHYLIDVHQYTGSTWQAITMDGTPPAAREYHAIAYNPTLGRFYICGGKDGSSNYDDTVVIVGSDNPSHLQWTTYVVEGYTARYGHSFVWDNVNNNAVLFGGQTAPGSYLGDTWTFSGSAWTLKSPTTSPSARSFHRMAWDPVLQRVVLWGGVNGGGKLSDAFMWTGSDWVALPLTGTKPSGRSDFAMALNTDTEMIFLFGGDGSLLNDTWGFVPGAVDANSLNIPLPLDMVDLINSMKAEAGYWIPPQ